MAKKARRMPIVICAGEVEPFQGPARRGILGSFVTNRTTKFCLCALITSLLLVGMVSNTPLRHAIQVTPPFLALVIVMCGVEWGRSAALSIFGFWLLVMALIWAYLLGIAHVITGQFTTAEIVLTVAIGVSSLWGLVRSGMGRTNWVARIAAMGIFLVLQAGALWVSMQPAYSHR
jgi:hypothetical protein